MNTYTHSAPEGEIMSKEEIDSVLADLHNLLEEFGLKVDSVLTK